MNKSMKRSSVTNNILYESMLVGNTPGTFAYEHIATTIVTTATPTISFNGLGAYSSTYKHLQLRIVARTTDTSDRDVLLRFNSDTGSNYSFHLLRGTLSSEVTTATGSSTFMYAGISDRNGGIDDAYGVAIVDILDYSNNSKNKTTRVLYGITANGNLIVLGGGSWNNTSAIAQIDLLLGNTASFGVGSRISIYGIKG